MKRLYVFADFDWLKEPRLIGELSYESLRGSDSYGFCYSDDWLRDYGNLFLSDDLNNYPGQQYTTPGKDIFGCFSDALPDRWGRTLINRREQILAKEEKHPVRRLSSFDYLIGIEDFSRMGAFRFKESMNGEYINASEVLRIPPLTDIRRLVAASSEIEKSEDENRLPEMRWIAQLVQPGSSLGGARPKASVIDENKILHIAKFPSRKDDYDTGLWEHFSHLLAKKAGIHAAETRVIFTNDKYHTLLSRRFDRKEDGKRIHFASAMTLLGLNDGDNANTGHGYLDIVDFILQNCTNVEDNLQELYRRVAFNICIGNTDDHFRNHGFLLTSQGWTLAPAYDVTWCEGPGGYHQMDVLGEALDIERKHLQQLGVQEAELSAEHVNAIIDKICHHATALSVTAKDKYADQITQTTLNTIQKQINDNVRRLMSL